MNELAQQGCARHARWLLLIGLGLAALSSARFAEAQDRYPAVPLITNNPYFSIWSMADHLTDINTRHWSGLDQPLIGIARIDGVAYRYMGLDPRQVPVMQQTSLQVTPLHTTYTFEKAGVRLEVRFFSPALPRDLELLSRPVNYLTWNVSSSDGRAHSVDLFLDVSPLVAVNTGDQDVVWGRSKLPGMDVLRVGSTEQRVLSRGGDNLRIDWGYFYLAVPNQPGTTLSTAFKAVPAFIATGSLPQGDDLDMPRQPRTQAAHLAAAFHMDVSTTGPQSRHVLLAYDDN
ncbi:MAG: DUF5127 domain-containing protein, partial [Acidobacteriaceae bacterium]